MRPLHKAPTLREYDRQSCVSFRKTTAPFGGLSNMAGGLPIVVNQQHILSSEALYQACRFPRLPAVQALILAERSPMTAKMKGKPYRPQSREDWERVRVNVMRWCLRVKLIHNWAAFSSLLLSTGELPIVEESIRDPFWGAQPLGPSLLRGVNVLGRLLMELREQVRAGTIGPSTPVSPLDIPEFLLLGQPIGPVPPPAPVNPLATALPGLGGRRAARRPLVPSGQQPLVLARPTQPPPMTPGRALLVSLVDRYLRALERPHVTLVELQKLLYFVQEAGEPLRLQFAKGVYGPYAKNLSRVLEQVEGQLLSGYVDKRDAPHQTLSVLPAALPIARDALARSPASAARFERVAALVAEFCSPEQIELLATVHWVSRHEGARSALASQERVYAWNERKRQFSPEAIGFAWQALERQGWLDGPAD